MKKGFLKMIAMTLVVGSSTLSHAGEQTFLDLSKGVSMNVPDTNRPNLIAFPIEGGCKNWLYIPTRLFLTGKYSHSTDFSTFTVNNQKVTALITLLKMNASPQITEETVNKLRSEIYQQVKADDSCNNKPARPEDIYLGPAQAKMGSARYALTSDQQSSNEGHSYWELYPNGSRTITPGTIMTSDPISLKYSLDATEQDAVTILNDAVDPGAQLGSISYLLHGVTARVNGKLVIKKDMIAEFQSRIIEICSKSKSKDKGGLLTTGGFGVYENSRNRVTCNQELLTNLVKADLDAYATLSLPPREANGKPTMIVPCDENGCKAPMDIHQYVRMELFNLLMEINLDYISHILETRGADKDHTRGANGEVTVNFQATSEFNNSITGYIQLSAQVITQNLTGTMNTDFTKWPSYVCATTVRKTPRFPGAPMAIPDQCLAQGTGR